MIHSKAPLRISFCGGGSDHRSWYEQAEGCVLSVAIAKYAHCEIERKYDQVINAYWADTPPGSGLGGSSAVWVARTAAEWKLHGRSGSPQHLARSAERYERELMGMPGGSQDYYPAALGGFNLIHFEGDAVEVRPLHAGDLARWLLLVRLPQREDKHLAAMPLTANALRKLVWLTESMALMAQNQQWGLLGLQLREAWVAKKESAPHCSTPRADAAISAAISAGAKGAKLTGAGGGGHVAIVCDPDRHEAVKAALEPMDLICEAVGLDTQGCVVEGSL